VTEIDDECSVAVLPEHLLRYVSLSVPSSLSEAVRKNQIRNILAVKRLITLSNRFCLQVIDANCGASLTYSQIYFSVTSRDGYHQ
jgi:hypothetical protein